jgi:LysR family transcriptional regulator of gallate degradation
MLLADHIRALRSVCAVTHTGSTVAAAEVLHVSQSSVARAVLGFEAASGQALFDRSGRGMQPTPACQALAARTTRALRWLAQTDLPGRKMPTADALGWARSRLASCVGGRHLSVLQSLASTTSETATARMLGISQSGVHQTLAQLEHMAGTALFLRARRGLRLTEAGETLLQAVKLAYAEWRQAADELALQRGVVQGRLLIGTLPFSTGFLLSESVDRVLRSNPGLGITVIDGTYDALLHQLRHADIDVIVGALRPVLPGPDLQQETLFLDELAVVTRASHVLAGKTNLNWHDLRDQVWIMPMLNTPAQAAFEQALKAANFPIPADPLRVNSALMMQALLAQGDRLALMSPRQIERELKAGLLVELSVPVRHAPRMIGVIRRVDYVPTPAAQSLFDALRSVAREIAEDRPDK